MTKAPIDTIESQLTVADAAKAMSEKDRGCLVVVNDGNPVGIITERDMIRRVIAKNKNPIATKVVDIMSMPLISTGSETKISDVAKLLQKNGIRRMVVIDNGKIVGMLSATDIVRAVANESEKDELLFGAILRSSHLPY